MIGNWDGEHIRLKHLAVLHLHLVTEASNAEDMLVPDLAVLDTGWPAWCQWRTKIWTPSEAS